MTSEELPLSLSDVSVSFEDTGVEVVSHANAAFPYGLAYIIGRNGAGKTTLLRALAGLGNLLLTGRATFEKTPLSATQTGLVTQDAMASICRDLTFRDNMLLAQMTGAKWLSPAPLYTASTWRSVELRLDKLAMSTATRHLWDRRAQHLSGGERQLLAILMRLGRGKRVLLLDECTASLDRANTEKVMSVLQRLNEMRCVALLVTHDLELIDEYKGPVFTIQDRQVRPRGASEHRSEVAGTVG